MYGFPIRYLASVFLDADSIISTPQDIVKVQGVIGEISKLPFLPMTVQEIGPAGLKMRMVFRTPNGDAMISLLSNRFDFSLIATTIEGSIPGTYAEFCKEASPLLIQLLQHFKRKTYRMASVEEGLLPDTSDHELEELSKRIFKFPPTYSVSAPFEWDWRLAAKIERSFGDLKESTNTICTIKRQTLEMVEPGLEMKKKQLDSIRFDIDINTDPNIIEPRFDDLHINSFFENAGSWHSTLGAEILSFIQGKS